MSLRDDYFLLYHGVNLDTKSSFTKIKSNIKDKEFIELSALILTLSRKNFFNIKSLNSFQNICKKFCFKQMFDLKDLYCAQDELINQIFLHVESFDIKHLHSSFDYLLKETIILNAEHKKLISLFDPSIFDDEKEVSFTQKLNSDFNEEKHTVLTAIKELQELIPNNNILLEVQEFINSKKFSVGITGVMNSGKSTMLNALMKKEILGTSVVPETANLTLLKYSKEPKARVVYWSKSQWKKIEKNALEIEAMQDFVNKTKNLFEEDLSNYILDTSRVDEIDVKDLKKYTSAEQSRGLCNLVQHVELDSNLHFLQHGIEIVDTPGLDDIVIQREEITKSYVSRCDLLIHLMNVSQSATAKDIDFILDALVFQNVSKLLIVITRVDMVEHQDVLDVIAYTKKAIETQLNKLHMDSKLEYILNNINFMPLSGQMALLHRTAREEEAVKLGYKLEDTGIVELEDYLHETLFSKDNEKAKMIILSAKHNLSRFINNELEDLKFEISILSKNENELEDELKNFEKKKELELKSLTSLKEQISSYEDEFTVYLESQKLILDKELKKLQTALKQRVLDELSYLLEKKKKTPSIQRVQDIVQMAIKHGLFDIIRDYRYAFLKKRDKAKEVLKAQYKDLYESSIEEDALSQGFLQVSNEVLSQRLYKVVSKSSLKTINITDKDMINIIKDEFEDFEEIVKDKAIAESEKIVKNLFNSFTVPIKKLEEKTAKNEKQILAQLENIQKDESSKEDKIQDLYHKIKMIQTIEKRFQL